MALLDELKAGPLQEMTLLEQGIFEARLAANWEDVLRPLRLLYGTHPQFEPYLHRFLHIVARAYSQRSVELRLFDVQRTAVPDWFQKAEMMGYVCYTDRFAGTLKGVIEKIPYLKELGVTYLHLMPLLQPRSGANDGGYAVANYREVDEKVGDMSDLRALATELRANGISLCIDLVCNHTAKDHEWAKKARAGERRYQDYYLMFPDRTMPDRYEETLPEVFPDFAPGNFTYYEEIARWVWTTFNEYQWDLNYANPAVLAEMLDVILFLANQGVEVLRLDAVAFMWKRLGTNSQNQPEAHAILQAFRALSRIAAPGLILKAEAIVSPNDLVPYFGEGMATNQACELAYHNVFMVLLWSALAERKVVLMTAVLLRMPEIPSGVSWVTYVRCHDDIGWAITEEDAEAVGLSGVAHRSFLSDFYSGRFANTFARGGTFQFNPRTGDRRINGSLASLAGLEMAVEAQDQYQIELAVRRILLLHSLIFAFGGIPLLYMGDELGLLNDHRYKDDPDLANDTRWMHRPLMDWEKAANRDHERHLAGRIFKTLCHFAAVRKGLPLLHAQAAVSPVWSHNDAVFGMMRHSPRGRLLVLANFTESVQLVTPERLNGLGFGGSLIDHLTETRLAAHTAVSLEPYQSVWLEQI